MEEVKKPWEVPVIQSIQSIMGGFIENMETANEEDTQCKLDNLRTTLDAQ